MLIANVVADGLLFSLTATLRPELVGLLSVGAAATLASVYRVIVVVFALSPAELVAATWKAYWVLGAQRPVGP